MSFGSLVLLIELQ